MPDSAANSDERRCHSAFKRGDVLIFVVFPLVLILGFLIFRWWPRTPADPNLRLVAQVTDDISVELVGVGQYTNQLIPSTKWWKPNGLLAEGVIPKSFLLGEDISNMRMFLFRVSERRPSVEPSLSGLALAGNWVSTDSSKDGATTIVNTTVSPTMFSTSKCGVKVATLGRQTVGVLTPELRSMTSVVHGQTALIEIGRPADLVPEGIRNTKSIWAVRITEATSIEEWDSRWQIAARDKTGRSIENKLFTQCLSSPLCHYWQFSGDDWACVTVERTVYDMEVVFDGVSAFEGSLTSPRVDYVGPVRSK